MNPSLKNRSLPQFLWNFFKSNKWAKEFPRATSERKSSKMSDRTIPSLTNEIDELEVKMMIIRNQLGTIYEEMKFDVPHLVPRNARERQWIRCYNELVSKFLLLWTTSVTMKILFLAPWTLRKLQSEVGSNARTLGGSGDQVGDHCIPKELKRILKKRNILQVNKVKRSSTQISHHVILAPRRSVQFLNSSRATS